MARKNRQFLNNRLAACTSWFECQENTGQTIADGKKNGVQKGVRDVPADSGMQKRGGCGLADGLGEVGKAHTGSTL